MNFMFDNLKEKGINASPIFASIDFIHVGKKCIKHLLLLEFLDKFDFTFIANKMARILAEQFVNTDIQKPINTSKAKTNTNCINSISKLNEQDELILELKRRINELPSPFEIPSGLKSINSPFFVCANISSIVIPESVVYIIESAFRHCCSLVSVKFISDQKLQYIGNLAFYGCIELIEIGIPLTVKYIGESAFSGCRKLKEINIPDLVSSIEARTFNGCSSLSKVTLGSSITRIKAPYTFYLCQSLKEINIPSSVKVIKNISFIGCSLSKVKIPANVYIEGTTFDSSVKIQQEI